MEKRLKSILDLNLVDLLKQPADSFAGILTETAFAEAFINEAESLDADIRQHTV